jgi:L-alanine-DL-glutamate epimerase-like enolase superfamily enzyme
MKMNFREHEIHLKSTFRTTHGASDSKRVLIVDIDGGLGEASPVYYYGENLETVKIFLDKARNVLGDSPFELESLGQRLDQVLAWNFSAKAAIDMAMHDRACQQLGIPVYRYYGITPREDLATSYTISISNPDDMKRQTEESPGFQIYKVKVGVPGDIEMVAAVRDATKARIRVDANEGWSIKDAIWSIKELEKLDVEFIEQPLHRDDFDGFRILHSRVDMPILADEGVFRSGDIPKYVGLVDGINIKLCKSGGLREAFKMIAVARAHRMKIMIGCMVETSVGITAAAHLASLVDYADLDGNVLISDDPYRGVTLQNGCLKLSNKPGLGVEPAR